MNKQLNKAVDLLEAIQLDLLNNEISINAVLVEQLGEFIDDYYDKVSFLNENFSKAIANELDNYERIVYEHDSLINTIILEDKDNRNYKAKYTFDNNKELIIIQPFEEI